MLTEGQTALSTKIDAVRTDIDTIARHIATGLAEIKQQITEFRTTLSR